jgi:carbon-monoxide dehydrogenase medium subunit
MSPVDTAPALIALGAKVEVVNANGGRWVALEEFFNNPGATILAEEEIITSIHIPRPPVNACQQYLKFSQRGTLDYGIASVGVLLFFEEKRKVCKEARIVLGGVDTIPVRALEAEELLRGREIKEVSFMEVAEVASKACHPWKDIETSSGYRRHLVRVLVKKALTYALENGEKGGDDYFKD